MPAGGREGGREGGGKEGVGREEGERRGKGCTTATYTTTQKRIFNIGSSYINFNIHTTHQYCISCSLQLTLTFSGCLSSGVLWSRMYCMASVGLQWNSGGSPSTISITMIPRDQIST